MISLEILSGELDNLLEFCALSNFKIMGFVLGCEKLGRYI